MNPRSRARRPWPGAAAAVLLAAAAAADQSAGEALQALRLRGPTARSAALLMSQQQGGSLPVEVAAVPMPAPGGVEAAAPVPVFVEMHGPALLAAAEGGPPRVEIYIYANDGDGRTRAHLAQVFTLAEEHRPRVAGAGVRFAGHLELPPGEYQLRVLVLAGGETFALRALPLRVPGALTALLPAPLPDPEERWLTVREAPHGTHRGGAALPGSLATPAARPVVEGGEEVLLSLLMAGSPPRPPAMAARLLDDGGEVLGPVPLTPREPLAGLPPGLAGWRVAARLPAAVTGPARLVVEAPGAPLTALPLVLVDPGAGGVLWVDLEGGEGAAETLADADLLRLPEAAPRPPGDKPRPKLGNDERRRIREDYRAALGHLAAGDVGGAVAAVSALEGRAVEGRSMEAVEEVEAAQLGVLAAPAERQPELLVPVLALHLDLYRHYSARRRFLLAAHAQNMVVELAELYAERGGSRGARITAAAALASLGGFLQEKEIKSGSERLFRLALELDESSEAALLGLAASHERFGEREEAISYLERLLRLRGEHAEGRLRLAMNLRQQGRLKVSGELLEGLTARDPPPEPWILALAYQERARLAQRGGDWAGAAELLQEAVARLEAAADAPPAPPRGDRGQAKLRLQLAYVLDRLGKPRRAAEILEPALRVAPRGEVESARLRYGRWPQAALEAGRRALAESAAVRRPLLAELVEGEEGASAAAEVRR